MNVMIVTPIKTATITAGQQDLLVLLDSYITDLQDGTVVAITSKIVSLCENNVVPFDAIDKETLVIQESDKYLPAALSKYGHHFTITNNILIAMAGIDESNGGDYYVLWPKDAQATANLVRAHFTKKFGLKRLGVIITDSTSHALRRGTIGICLAHSGFSALNSYVGQPDLFGRPFAVSRADVASGLANSAVLQMGEGTERTPIALITDVDFVTFLDHDPTPEELETTTIPLEDDLFAPFLTSVTWKLGERQQKQSN